MAGARQPIELVVAKGKKHLTKAEIEERKKVEITPCVDDMSAPSYLTASEKKRFNKIVEQLTKLNIIGETDTETLARYITAQTQYETSTKNLRAFIKSAPNLKDFEDYKEYLEQMDAWTEQQEKLAKLQDRYFKQAQTAASALGLTITSRCKLIAPQVAEAPKVNKFAQFSLVSGDGD